MFGLKYAHGFLWENGTMFNLNKLIPPGSGFKLTCRLTLMIVAEIATWGDLQHRF